MLNYVLGDLLESNEGIIAHGCNAQGAFGSGVAGAIRKKYVGCYETYAKHHKEKGLKLGDVIIYVDDVEDLAICNCITQEFYGPGDKLYANYDAIKLGIFKTLVYIEELNKYLDENDIEQYKSLGIPLIGCGLAGGDFSIVEKILQDLTKEFNIDINIYILDEFIYRGLVEKYQPVQL